MASTAAERIQEIRDTIYQRGALDVSGDAFDIMMRNGSGPLLLRQPVDAQGGHSMRDAAVAWIHRQFRSDDPEVIMQRMHDAGFTNFRIYNMGTGDGESRSNHQGGVLVDESQSPPIIIALTRGTNIPEDLSTHAYDSVSFGLGILGVQTTLGGYKTNSDRYWAAAGEENNNNRVDTLDEIYAQVRANHHGVRPTVIFSGSSYGADAASRGALRFGQQHPDQRGHIQLINYGPASSLNRRERDEIGTVLDPQFNYYYDLPGDIVPDVSGLNRTHRPMGTREGDAVEIAHSGSFGLRAHLSYYESLSLHACRNFLYRLALDGNVDEVGALLALYREDPEMGMRAIMTRMRASCYAELNPELQPPLIAESGITTLDARDRAALASLGSLVNAGTNGVLQEGMPTTGIVVSPVAETQLT